MSTDTIVTFKEAANHVITIVIIPRMYSSDEYQIHRNGQKIKEGSHDNLIAAISAATTIYQTLTQLDGN